VPELTLAVVLPPPLRALISAVALPTLFSLGTLTALIRAVVLPAKTRLTDSEQASAPQADATKERDQVRTTRHGCEGEWTVAGEPWDA